MAGTKNSYIADEILSWRWNERNNPFDELVWCKLQMSSPICVWGFELQPHAAVCFIANPIFCNRPAQNVPAKSLQFGPLMGQDFYVRMQAKSIIIGATSPYEFLERWLPDFTNFKRKLEFLISILHTLGLELGLVVVFAFKIKLFD